jgi:hypothetical protein
MKYFLLTLTTLGSVYKLLFVDMVTSLKLTLFDIVDKVKSTIYVKIGSNSSAAYLSFNIPFSNFSS